MLHWRRATYALGGLIETDPVSSCHRQLDLTFDSVPRLLVQLALADVQCARSSDFGKNDEIHCTRTHLGNVLKAGDIAWG